MNKVFVLAALVVGIVGISRPLMAGANTSYTSSSISTSQSSSQNNNSNLNNNLNSVSKLNTPSSYLGSPKAKVNKTKVTQVPNSPNTLPPSEVSVASTQATPSSASKSISTEDNKVTQQLEKLNQENKIISLLLGIIMVVQIGIIWYIFNHRKKI